MFFFFFFFCTFKKYREELVTGKKVSTEVYEPTYVDSAEKQYTVVKISDACSDAGQTTIPLFDAQPVQSKSYTPLAGIGLHHRTSPGYSGYLALTGYTHDLQTIMKDSYYE